MTWCVIELAGKPAGYADHKPPYDFKHGWVPITGQAKTDVAEKVKKPQSPADLTDDQLRRLPPNVAKNKYNWPKKKWADSVDGYLSNPGYDYSKTPAAKVDPPATRADLGAVAPSAPAKKPTRAPATKRPVRKRAPARASETLARGLDVTPVQRKALDDPDSVDPDDFLAEWESSVETDSPLTDEEIEAADQWQNGYTEAFFDEEDEDFEGSPETGLYLVLNDMLRGSGQYDLGMLDEEDTSNMELINERMKSALDKSRTTRDVTVFRGVANWQDAKVGDTVTDAGWQATSYSPATASAFLGGGNLGAAATSSSKMMVIRVPKGKNALRVREKQQVEKVFGSKNEIVLGPDTPLLVTAIEGDRIYLEVQ